QKLRFLVVCLQPKVCEDGAPDRRTRDCYGAEDDKVHAHDSGRNRDEMAHHWQQSRKKDAPGLVTTQPNLGTFEFFGADEKPSAVANDQGAAKSTRYPVGYRRAKIGADCPGNDNTPKIQMSLRGE